MNAREIEIFRTIMGCGTLSAAAQVLNVTQPALSNALRRCEDRLGFKLFNRHAGRLSPTAEANFLIADANRIHEEIQSFGAKAREVGGRAGGILRLGVTASPGLSIVPMVVDRLRHEFPNAALTVQVLPVAQLEQALTSRRLDVGLALSAIQIPDPVFVQLGSVRCVVALPEAHALAAKAEITPADLQSLPEIGFARTTDFGASVQEMFEAACIPRTLAIEVSTAILAVALVQAGSGFAIVDGLARSYLPQGVVARKLRPALIRPLIMASTDGSGTSRLVSRFGEIVANIAATAGSSQD